MMEKTQAKPLTAAQQRQRDKKRRTWLRTGVQLFFFVFMPGAFVAGFSGVKQIFLHIGAGEVLSVDSFTLSLLGLCGFTLLFDRFFCGYACAFGSLGDAVWALSGLIQKKLFHRKKQLRLPERAVLLGQKVKYLLLAGLVALYVTRQEKMLTGASPWEVFSRLTALHLTPEGFGVGIGLLVLILLGMAVQPRFFCQFLCPMGAVFALLPVLPFARLHRQSDGCIPGCNACKQQCPVCLKLEEPSLRSGECIACEACVGTCPKQNIHRWDTTLCKRRCWVKCCSSSCWAAGWAFADSSELKKEAAAQYLCSSLLLAGRSIISIRRSICGRSGVPFLQGRLLLQQVCHAAQADAKGGKVMQHGAGGRGQDAQSPQKDEGRVEAEHRLFALQNRQRFGDAGRLYAQCVGCFRHRS